MHEFALAPASFILFYFFWHSQPKLALHLPTWGADSSAWQIRDFSASVFPCVCCFCLSGCGLLWWLSNPQALIITWRCLSLTFGSACRQSQVWTRLSEVDAAVLHFYCWLHRRGGGLGGGVVLLSRMDFLVHMSNICSCLLKHSKLPLLWWHGWTLLNLFHFFNCFCSVCSGMVVHFNALYFLIFDCFWGDLNFHPLFFLLLKFKFNIWFLLFPSFYQSPPEWR